MWIRNNHHCVSRAALQARKSLLLMKLKNKAACMSPQQSKLLISRYDCMERETLYENKRLQKLLHFLEHWECKTVNILQWSGLVPNIGSIAVTLCNNNVSRNPSTAAPHYQSTEIFIWQDRASITLPHKFSILKIFGIALYGLTLKPICCNIF